MKKNILILAITICANSSFGQTQQFTIIQLCNMLNDVKNFESNMLKVGNTPKKNDKKITYSASYENGGISAGRDIPTNDSKYDELWKWPDGRILTKTQIEDNELDVDFKIRNKLNDDDQQPINEKEIEGFRYSKNKITNLVKCNKTNSEFYKDYDGKLLTGVYEYESNTYKLLIGDKTHWKNSKTIQFSFWDESLYKNYIGQISKISKYIETKKDNFDQLVSYYKYGVFLISTKIETDENYTTYCITVSL
jgi:hypothetical protein